MSEQEQEEDLQQQQHDRKGKRRAIIHEPSERTPLLGGTSQIPWTVVTNDAEDSSRFQRTLWSRLTTVFIVSLLICIIAFVAIALLAWSYAAKAASLTPQDLINNDLVFDGPQRLHLMNVTSDGGVWVTVHGRIGVDVGDAMGINSDPNDSLLRRLWKKIGRQSVRTLNTVSVSLSTVTVMPELDPFATLATLNILPLDVPLSVDPPKNNSWLTPVAIQALVHPTTNTTLFSEFLHDAWRRGYFAVRADVDKVIVRGGALNSATWRAKFHGKLSNIRTSLRMKVPSLPGLPHPGEDAPLPDPSELIVLKSFGLKSSSSNLSITAKATMLNPTPKSFEFTSPPLPFTVSIFDEDDSPIDMASVVVTPFSLTRPNITLNIEGSVVPLKPASFPALSSFLMRYLNGESNRITIASSFPALALATNFPGPNPRPHLLRNVTIQDMKLKARGAGGQFLASGTVFARIVLPKGMNIALNVSRVLPDVLIFDGELNGRGARPEPPLPDPLPEKAFGRIRPEDWLNAESVPDDSDEGEGSVYAVSAQVKDVPLEVLPGRQKEFSNFVSKVIFTSDGAIAGLQGTAAVTVQVEGLPVDHAGPSNHLDLAGLPFQGSVRINKKTLLHGQAQQLQHIIDHLGEYLPF